MRKSHGAGGRSRPRGARIPRAKRTHRSLPFRWGIFCAEVPCGRRPITETPHRECAKRTHRSPGSPLARVCAVGPCHRGKLTEVRRDKAPNECVMPLGRGTRPHENGCMQTAIAEQERTEANVTTLFSEQPTVHLGHSRHMFVRSIPAARQTNPAHVSNLLGDVPGGWSVAPRCPTA